MSANLDLDDCVSGHPCAVEELADLRALVDAAECAIASAQKERDALRAQVDEWRAKAANWMASPEAGQRLDGYRELADKCAGLESEAWLALVEEGRLLESCRKLGAQCATLVAERDGLRAEVERLRDRWSLDQYAAISTRAATDKDSLTVRGVDTSMGEL